MRSILYMFHDLSKCIMLVIGDAGAGGEESVPGSRSSRTRPRSLAYTTLGWKVEIDSRDDPTAFIVSRESSPQSGQMKFRSTLKASSQKSLRQSSPQSLIRIIGAQE